MVLPPRTISERKLTIFTNLLTRVICTSMLLPATALAQSTASGLPDPLTLHPVQIAMGAENWNRDLGQFGESLVRNFERVRGNTVFDLNIGEHGIDSLIRSIGPGGQLEYRLIEVKTLQTGTNFQLKDTILGKQLSYPVIEDRLRTAVVKHPDAATRKAATEALEQFRTNPASLKAELHGVSIGDNRYIVRAVDSAAGTIKGEIASPRVTDVLKNLSERSSSEEVRRMATRHLAEYDQLQAGSKRRIVNSESLAREMAKLAGVDEEQMDNALTEAAEHIKAPGQSRWVKAGGKVFKFIGRAAGPAGVVIGAAVFTSEAADIEQRFERSEIGLEQANVEHSKLAIRTTGDAGGAFGGVMAGAAIGTFICPGAGTVIGGIVGGVGGGAAADLIMAATGLTDTLAEYLCPGVDGVRKACGYLKTKGIQVAVTSNNHLREWVGPENYDETIATMTASVTWVRKHAAATAVADAAVAAKYKTVELGSHASKSVLGGAVRTRDKAKSGYNYIRGWLP